LPENKAFKACKVIRVLMVSKDWKVRREQKVHKENRVFKAT
jgi:hypothetical protein